LKLSVCAKRNIIDAKHHIICGLAQLHLSFRATSFICAASGNDVDLTVK
jgi:hypothetical protein